MKLSIKPDKKLTVRYGKEDGKELLLNAVVKFINRELGKQVVERKN